MEKTIKQIIIFLMQQEFMKQYPDSIQPPAYRECDLDGDYFPLHIVENATYMYAQQEVNKQIRETKAFLGN